MLDRPDARELLLTARQTLLERLLPALPEAQRYDALMVSNALAIAVREVELDAPAAHRERAALADLLGATGQGLDLPELRRVLGSHIRLGMFDHARRDELMAVLHASVEARLAISNPKLLAAGD
ncbi:MAG: hypothetical protein KF778_12305 [Rhodocyclaceae bacterium]|nr:hypothetical protein [Rhodocyclaceae bacterium]MBX3669181.1 hypothetical protein [Rhodocyclaceae bacterium]